MSEIDQQFAEYSTWRKGLFGAITDFRAWLQTQELSDAQADQRLDQVLSTLRDEIGRAHV